jgi:hypothetical protein
VVDLEDNPDRDLCRYEFFEILVRMAIVKYQTLSPSPRQAFEKLLADHVYPHSETSNAVESRWETIYTVHINDVLETNLDSIQELFNRLKGSPPKYMMISKLREYIVSIDPKFREKDFIRAY